MGDSSMGPAPVLFLGSQSLAMLLLVSVYPIHLFDLIDAPLSSFRVFYCSMSLPLSSCLDCIPLLVGLPFLRSLLTRMLSFVYAYYVVVFCLCLLFLLLLVFLFLVSLFLFVSLLRPFLATMPFAGYFPVRFLLSAPSVFFSENVIPSGKSVILITKTSNQTRQRGHTLSTGTVLN